MTLTLVDSRVLTAQQLNRMAAAYATSGVYKIANGDGGAVTPNANLVLNVAAITKTNVLINDATPSADYAGSTVTHDAADATYPRIDIIYYNASGAVGIKKGTPAAAPVPPDLASTEIADAAVYIAANATTLSAGNISDMRTSGPSTPTALTLSGLVQKYKTATQTISATTTYADVTAASGNLAFDVAANEVWSVEWIVPVTSVGAGGLKFQVTGPSSPSGVVFNGYYWGWSNGGSDDAKAVLSGAGAAAFSTEFLGANGGTADGNYDTGAGLIRIVGVVRNGSNAGTVTLQAAQKSASGSTVFNANCYMRAMRVA